MLGDLLSIVTGGGVYTSDGRLEVSVSFSMDAMAGNFSITQSGDLPPGMEFVYPDLGMGGPVTIYLDGKIALTGQVDRREGSGEAGSYRITITGRSKTAHLVDGSAVHDTGQWDNRQPLQIIRDLLEPYGIDLVARKSVEDTLRRFILRDGETVERAIRRVSREFGLVPFGDETGALRIEDSGGRGSGCAFVLGHNILSWTASQDMQVRHSEVRVKGQAITDDHVYGRPATDIVAAVQDSGVAAFRPLIVPFWGDANRDRVRRRAWIEALRRQGESINVRVTVAGFTDPVTGDLYRPNVLHHVSIPVDGVDNVLVAKSVTHRLSGTEARTEIELVPEKAFSDGSEAGKGKASGGKSAARRKTGGSTSTGADDSRIWYDAFSQVKDMEIKE